MGRGRRRLLAALALLGAACSLQGCGGGEPGPAPQPLPPRPAEPGDSGAPAGRFESWVLGLEWQPAWSAADCHGHRAVERRLTNASFAASHVSLHGLWPEYAPGKHRNASWPQFCEGPQGAFEVCEKSGSEAVCQPPREAVERFNTTEAWQTFAMEYAWGALAMHEWSKHGSCTGWNASYYFGVAVDTYRRARRLPGPRLVEASLGRKVPLQTLLGAFNNTAQFLCHRCDLTDIFIAFAADRATLMPLDVAEHPGVAADLAGSCAGCSEVQVPAWKGCPRHGGDLLVV